MSEQAAQDLTPEEQERRDRKTMDLAERKKADRATAKYRSDARKAYEAQSGIAATKEKEYKVMKATRYVELRAGGETGEGSRIRADGDETVSELRKERDIAAGLAKAALLRVDEAERNATTVRDIHRVSTQIDGVGA